ncbi:thymocyte nuclear protein 1-like [Sitodiplosis mosellana]|uniref:thymocyte nuclear protein 1-like n=1 Tax=Sitodiplosis mosellana TaxID=263140 RepID=UPI002443E019|nr:thymocyte nuclear protein 1-like [Sitodiplosis mosellana]
MTKNEPQYWLLKVEPSDYPWSKMETDGKTTWNGIHNHQAQNFLKAMKCGDLAFYYHTEKEKAIVGIVKIVKEFYHNDDPKFGEVDVESVRRLKNPVTLKTLKESPDLQSLTILKQPRLSVSSITPAQWGSILELSEVSDE